MKKKVIFAPHVDDDVLGCGSILDKESVVIYCGLDESSIPNRPSMETRLAEADAVQEYLGHSYRVLDNKVNQYSASSLIAEFESVLNEIKPSDVFIPHYSYNQDHRAVYNAALTALRPHDKNHFVPNVYVYEQPHTAIWDNKPVEFIANYFLSLDVEKKINAYLLMETQVRNFRSCDMIKAMAKLRGSQSGFDYAEAFQIIRMVKK